MSTYGYLGIGLIALLLAGGAVQLLVIFELRSELSLTNTALTETRETLAREERTKTQLEEELANVRDELAATEKDREDLAEQLEEEEDRNEKFEEQIEDLAGTVGTLDKLSKTDEELLKKYSRVYFLNENYIPTDLDEIDQEYVLEGQGDQYFHGDALTFLEDLMEDANDDDIDLRITSAYRSFDEQNELKGQYLTQYGSGANTFSADQGYSEHQLGTTVDFTTDGVPPLTEAFAQTEAYEWLTENAHRHGFILSYPEGNEFYVFEPWHWRFVGEELARELHNDDRSFYDVPQRELDEYLVSIFD